MRVFALALLGALVACAHQPPPPPRDLVVHDAPIEAVSVYIEGNADAACGIASSRVVYDPLATNAELRTLAHCLAWGPLAGGTIELVGQGDPMLSAGAGQEAGVRRAHAIERFLVDEGVARHRVVVESAREREAAVGSGSFASARRVDVVLVAR